MAFCRIALDDIANDAKRFSIEDANHPEKIREGFQEKTAPIIIYEEGDMTKGKVFGKDILEDSKTYVWYTKKEVWKDAEMIQNALFCSIAVYKENPFKDLQEVKPDGESGKTFHTVNQVVAVGDYKKAGEKDDSQQRCLLALAQTPGTGKKMLVVALRGSKSEEDWRDNMKVSQKTDRRYPGSFHSGFHTRANRIDIQDILAIADFYEVEKILTCGHSLGGAVSSIIHMNLLNEERASVEKKNIINITFGAPCIGNEALENYARRKEMRKNMFQFAAVDDIVPSLLSLGHTVKVIIRKMQSKLSENSSGLSEVWKHGARFWMEKNSRSVELCDKALGIYIGNSDSGRLKDAYSIIKELQKSSESTMQNEYKENSFVPMGNTIVLARGRPAEMLDNSCKITERILQASVDIAASEGSLLTIKVGHSCDNYEELIKVDQEGFKTFPLLKFKMNKVPLANCLKETFFVFKNLCTFVCPHPGCTISTKALYEEEHKIAFCQTCQEDPEMEEFMYHESCSEKCKSDHHVVISLKETLLEKTTQERQKIFEDSVQTMKALYDHVETGMVSSLISGAGATSAVVVNVTSVMEAAFDHVIEAGVSTIANSIANSGGGVAGFVFVANVAMSTKKWWTGEISGKEYIESTIIHAAQAGGGFFGTWGGAAAGGAIGGAFAGPIGALVGAFLGGVVGGLAGSITAKLITEKLLNWIDEWWSGKGKTEEDQRAGILAEAMVFLETPDIDSMKREDVQRCYRRKTLLHHPDKLPKTATKQQKDTANKNFHALVMAKDILIQFLELPTYLSSSCKEKVKVEVKKGRKAVGLERLRRKMEAYDKANPKDGPSRSQPALN